jgi:hypothetical protein
MVRTAEGIRKRCARFRSGGAPNPTLDEQRRQIVSCDPVPSDLIGA